MVGLAGILSPIPQASVKEALTVTSETRNKLEAVVANMIELVSPLSSVSTRGEMKRLLDRLALEYLHLKNEAGRLIMDELPAEEFARFATKAYEELLNLIRADVTVLSAEDGKLLVDVVESLRELLQGVLDIPAENQGRLTDTLLECSSALQRVDMCLLAIFFVLTRETGRWNPGAIRLLARAAQEYMRQVEDTFLIHDSELAERLRTRQQTVSLAEVRKEVGLHS